jgi:hypothetical protein
MKFMQTIANKHVRLSALYRTASFSFPVWFPAASPARWSRAEPNCSDDDRYRLTPFRTLAHHAIGALPPLWRERAAERLLRRTGAPGPAAEHVVQYLLSAAKSKRKADDLEEATVAKGADLFYERQYRQYFNPVMGAFAMTATRALLGSGGIARGRLWRRRRLPSVAMQEGTVAAPPIIVINHQTAAVPLLLPKPGNRNDFIAVARWLTGNGSMPSVYRPMVAGEEVRCAERGLRARERCADGALLELMDAVTCSRKLAILALHPLDPDAMGLHITLFGVQFLTPKFLEHDYGLGGTALDPWRSAASANDRLLVFCVGGTEEIFTQCSQNLFVKRPQGDALQRSRAVWPNAWNPALPLERLLEAQFEILQVTVSASGLPGASPRNGKRGDAAFVGRRNSKTFILVPYHPGNAIHGHAAKLWSNPYGTLVIWDDTCALTAVTISGPSQVVTHDAVKRDFPSIAVRVAAGHRNNGASPPDPEYWHLQEIADLVQQSEPLSAHSLDPARPTCSISAGGQARHGKKPAYFAADTLPPYNQLWQHEREAAGRSVDPGGDEHRLWRDAVQGALEARLTHLGALRG